MRKRFSQYKPTPFSDTNLSSRPRQRRSSGGFQNFTSRGPLSDREDTGQDGRTYWYIHVKPRTMEERRIFDGPHDTEQAAYDFAYQNMPDKRFYIVPSPYRDPARATQALKHNILTDEGKNKMDEALKRVNHNIKKGK